MKPSQEALNMQINFSKFQRNAGGDYNEYFAPRNIRMVLATTPEEELDAMAESNGRMFRYRFGFEATLTIRQQVIELREKYDLSDGDIRCLKRAGHLRISRTGITIDHSRLMPIAGWIQITLFSVFCAAMIFQVAFSGAQGWKQELVQTFLVAIWFAGASLFFKLQVAPWDMLKRSGAIMFRPAGSE